MAVVPLTTSNKVTGVQLFALGFRPFFLLAGLSGLVLMSLWLLMLANWIAVPAYYPGHYWHSHEMLFGYTVTVIVGFLLTAARNWTGVQTLHGQWLAGLALLWLAGRLLPFFQIGSLWIAIVDLSFLPLAGIAVGYPIHKARQFKNIFFAPMIIGLWLANLLMHLQLLGLTGTLEMGQRLGVALIMMLIVIMGTRVIPFFIERGADVTGLTGKWPAIELVGNMVMALWAATYLIFGDNELSGSFALTAALLLTIRSIGWYAPRLWKVPMAWILYLGFLWVPIGLAMRAMTVIGWTAGTYSTHAFTVGAIGCLTLGMMTRVTLGHIGRQIAHNMLTLVIFITALSMPITRLMPALPMFAAENYFYLHLSGGLWTLAFLLYLVGYGGKLIMARADGAEG